MLNDKLAKSNRKFLDRVMMVAAFILFIIAPACDVMAGEQAWPGGPTVPHNDYLRIGWLAGSSHISDGDWNEEQKGFYIGYNGWAVGQYENSFSNVRGYGELNSAFVTYEIPIHRKDWLETSFTIGVVDGYPEEETTFGRSTLPWVSFNIRFGGEIGAKLWHVPTAVTAYGIEYRKDLSQ